MSQTIERSFPTRNADTTTTADLPRRINRDEHYVTEIENTRVGLGAAAVRESITNAEYTAIGMFDDHRELEQDMDKMLGKKIKHARGVLESIAGTKDKKIVGHFRINGTKRSFNKFISRHDSSKALDTLLGFDPDVKGKDYVKRLTEKDENGQYVVNDEAFVNFLEWHNHELAQLQTEYDNQHEQQKTSFRNKLTKAITDGWVPSWVNEWADERLANVAVVVDDGFRTSHGKGGGTLGTALRTDKGGEVALAPGQAEKPERTLIHEFIHAIDGYNKEGSIYNSGLYKLFGGRTSEAATALNEAVVEHLADSMHTGKALDTVDPQSRQRRKSMGVYDKERYLLNVLTTMGKEKIDVRVFIAAHFDDGEHLNDDGTTPTEKLRIEIEKAFPGQDVLAQLSACKTNKDVYKYTKQLRRFNYGRFKKTKEELKKATAALALGTTALGFGMGLAEMARPDVPQFPETETSVLLPNGDTAPNFDTYPDSYPIESSDYDTPSISGGGPADIPSTEFSPGSSHGSTTHSTGQSQNP